MASDVGSPYPTSLTILFFLLIMFHTTMANKDHRFLLGTTRDGGYFKKGRMEFSTTRPDMRNVKTVSKANVIHIPPQSSRRRGRFRAHRSPLPWQEGIFSASAHEVPSGPNPLSNR